MFDSLFFVCLFSANSCLYVRDKVVLFGRMLHKLDQEETFQIVAMDENGNRSVKIINLSDVRQFLYSDFHLGRFGSVASTDEDEDPNAATPATQKLFSVKRSKKSSAVKAVALPQKKAVAQLIASSSKKRQKSKSDQPSSNATATGAATKRDSGGRAKNGDSNGSNALPDISQISLNSDVDSGSDLFEGMEVDDEDGTSNVSSRNFLLNAKLERTTKLAKVTVDDCFRDPNNYNYLRPYEGESEIVFMTCQVLSGVTRTNGIDMVPSRHSNYLSTVQCNLKCFLCNELFDTFHAFDIHYYAANGREYFARFHENIRNKDVVVVYAALRYVVRYEESPIRPAYVSENNIKKIKSHF